MYNILNKFPGSSNTTFKVIKCFISTFFEEIILVSLFLK